MLVVDISQSHLDNFSTIERVCSCLSLIGCTFIGITFLGSKAFHKPINRLVFFASVGNIMSNVATMMARAVVETKNFNGPACQFQGFLIQMFLPADAYWTLAMALNVYLTFYHKLGAEQLHRLEKYYVITCYGLPFIPAFVYIFVSTPGKGHMYGNATLWCWVADKWDIFRIITFYVPVWMAILVTIAIYTRAGKDIYKKRQQLRNFKSPPPDPIPILADPFSSVKTTDIYVSSESAAISGGVEIEHPGTRPGQQGSPQEPPPAGRRQYTVTISAPRNEQPLHENVPRFSYPEETPNAPSSSPIVNRIPSSAHANFPGNNLYPTRKHAAMEANNAIWSYTKVAVLFFAALMITWIPSSANRVYSVICPNSVYLPLEYASSFVLPLQGFWNALIYATTSLPACREFWDQIRTRKHQAGCGPGLQTIIAAFRTEPKKDIFTRRSDGHKFISDSDSMTELQQGWPTSNSSRPTSGGV